MNMRYILLIFIILLLVLIPPTAFLFVGKAIPAERIAWGATFAQSQAQDLGLDWRETYLKLLDDVGVREFRLPVYWDELEKENNVFDFSPWDWQIGELQKRDGRALLAIGFKLPRWPECRLPERLKDKPRPLWEADLFRMLRAVVEHYKDNSTVWAWQIENEPLLDFGVCPAKDARLLDAEIELVRKLDPSRPIVITDTGENSLWYESGKRADIIGSTVFRVIHDPRIGFVRYPYPPVMYYRKSIFAHWAFGKHVIFTEAQAEPWVTSPPISSHSLEAQYYTMSPELLRANIQYFRETGFDTIYLWGAEWWYWTKKTGGTDEIWSIVKEAFVPGEG